MKWLSIYEDGIPKQGKRILAYSECYKDKPELAFRILDSQFISMCSDVTHYAYLKPPEHKQPLDSDGKNSSK